MSTYAECRSRLFRPICMIVIAIGLSQASCVSLESTTLSVLRGQAVNLKPLVLAKLSEAPHLEDPLEVEFFFERMADIAPRADLTGTSVSELTIEDIVIRDRWLVLEARIEGASYRMAGQILSDDLLKRYGRIEFKPRDVVTDTGVGALPDNRKVELWGKVRPALEIVAISAISAGGVV